MGLKKERKELEVMYGKIFASMYEGSIVGAGATVFAVMGYVIAKQKPPEFVVELNPKLLGAILGEASEDVEKAIEFLCSPDPDSRTQVNEGRRLVKVGAFAYHVVNGAHYHSLRNMEERREYNRAAQLKWRAKHKGEPAPEETESETSPKEAGTSKRFVKPTVEDFMGTGLPEDEAFKMWHYYESKGWKVGNHPMKNWKSAAAGWKSRMEQYRNQGKQEEERPMTDEEIVAWAKT